MNLGVFKIYFLSISGKIPDLSFSIFVTEHRPGLGQRVAAVFQGRSWSRRAAHLFSTNWAQTKTLLAVWVM